LRTVTVSLCEPNLTDATPAPGRTLTGKLARCLSVSVLTTAFSLVSLIVMTGFLGIAAMTANVATTAMATVPSYQLNRRWTWARTDGSDLWREVVPFWLLSFAGLALSTVTVGIADSWASGMHLAPDLRTGAVLVGHLGGFGLLWVAQFVLLDRVLFARPAAQLEPAFANASVASASAARRASASLASGDRNS
jgi:putative flippase GtrA